MSYKSEVHKARFSWVWTGIGAATIVACIAFVFVVTFLGFSEAEDTRLTDERETQYMLDVCAETTDPTSCIIEVRS